MADAPWWTDGAAVASLSSGFGVGYWSRDLESGRLECSESCRPVLGIEPESDLESFESLRSYVHSEDRTTFDETIALAVERGHPYRVDHRVVSPRGAVRWVATRCGLQRTPSGRVVLAGVALDITAQKEMEEEWHRAVAQEQRFHAIVDQLPAAVLIGEAPSGRIVFMNDTVQRIFPTPPGGYSIDSADLFRAWEAFHADGRPVEPHERPLLRALQGETVRGEDFRYKQADGGHAWIRLSSAPIRDASGVIVAAAVMGTDIDQAKRAEEALRASERRLRQLFESPVIGIVHSSIDGPITSANDIFLQTFGYTREDLAAGRLNWVTMTPPEYRAPDEAALDDLRTTGSALVYEKEYLRKDGSRVPIALGSTMLEGSSTEIVTFILDISDRKKADRERESLIESLALSEERYRLAAMATEDAIYDWDINTDRVSVHAMFGPRPAGISSGRIWSDFIHPADRERVVSGLHAAIARGDRHWQAEYRFAKGDGSWMDVVDRGYVARDAGGKPLRLVGAMQDVTARRRQEEFERQLIGIVSHDLKNPLQTIFLAVEMMQRADDIGDSSRKNVGRIQMAARRATRLIRDLLDFTRARLGAGIPIERRDVVLTPVFETLLEEARAQHPGRAIELRSSGDLRGDFDADRLGQVLTNLVENALKYSPPDAPVRVELRGEPDAVVFSVHNDGAPISPDLQERIFEPMQRGDAIVDPTGRSVGLGLYIVKQLVEAHEGTVEVRSSAEEGTTFVVRLRRTMA